jgi:hypothetical protein
MTTSNANAGRDGHNNIWATLRSLQRVSGEFEGLPCCIEARRQSEILAMHCRDTPKLLIEIVVTTTVNRATIRVRTRSTRHRSVSTPT